MLPKLANALSVLIDNSDNNRVKDPTSLGVSDEMLALLLSQGYIKKLMLGYMIEEEGRLALEEYNANIQMKKAEAEQRRNEQEQSKFFQMELQMFNFKLNIASAIIGAIVGAIASAFLTLLIQSL